jgi:redox-sensitive bicupin YhaK (pirin superfamily)
MLNVRHEVRSKLMTTSEIVDADAIELLLEARPHDLGMFAVRRAIPSVQCRRVGPFVFVDHMGPAHLQAGAGIDVRPHPHIELATVSYLFDGDVEHRDSLGSIQTIRPGDVGWMIAGRGIVHSERSGPEARRTGARIHGVQTWVALPLEHETMDPRFEHHPASTIPRIARDGVVLDVIAGAAYGARSPVGVLSPTLYVHARVDAGGRLVVDDEYEERAIYLVEGAIACNGKALAPGTMAVLRPGAKVEIAAGQPSRVMLVGGAKLAGDRYLDWNFVSSSKERLERAKIAWRSGRFPRIPSDDIEFIPLPESRSP